MGDRLIAGRYRLDERIGAGGMGVVWRATDQDLGRVVALKRSQAGDTGQIRREARIGAGLHHPNVITVFDAVIDGDERWLVMEYLPSRSLADIVDTDGPLPPGQVAKIGAQLGVALAAMHDKGMVHCDLKPGNVLVAEDGTAKLADLGIAQWAEVTRTGGDLDGGTPGYLAPEMAKGEHAGAAADVFSLGATLFAAVEGVSVWGDATSGPFVQRKRAMAYTLEPMRQAGPLAPALTELLRRKPAGRPSAFRAAELLAEFSDGVVTFRPVPDGAVLDRIVDPAHPNAARSDLTLIPRQLPAAPALFVGRNDELRHLDAAMNDTDGSTAPAVCAIGGAGGIGKTWLALHWSHRHLDRFPDGQLFVDLRGFGPDGEPMNPAVAVRGFLDALGIDPSRIPVDLHAQAALYRSLLAGKRILVVLDNAVDTSQVTPLLPGSDSCSVVVTSRNRLSGLIISHGARPLPLDVLTHAEARAVLTERLGSTRVEDEASAADELSRLCGSFPLALSIVAAHALSGRSLASLATDLRDLGLDALNDDDVTASVPTVLSWSLSSLTAEQRTVFALLGIAPGPDIGLPAIGSLTGLPLPRVRTALHTLENASLVRADARGRYSIHDLLREYAATMAHRDIPESTRTTALRRVADFYLHTAHSGELMLYSSLRPLGMEPPAQGFHPRILDNKSAATVWFDAEHASLLATQLLAAQQGWHHCAWNFAWSLKTFHRRRGHVHDELAVWRTAAASSRHIDDPVYLAGAHRALAQACVRAGHHTDALRHMHQALTITGSTTPEPFNASSYSLEQALNIADTALSFYRTQQDPLGEADSLAAAGWLAAKLGDYDRARDHCESALALFRRHHDRVGEGQTLDSLGYLAHHVGRHDQAISYYQQALALRREIGDLYGEAVTLNHFAELHTDVGRHEHARAIERRAHKLYEQQERRQSAQRVQRQLDELVPLDKTRSTESTE
ncbi:protein kinase [Amycolatopsis umgeniensis]|uniref:non-specific serine/threonine protein kinase n=1 Tax=Amycolatopsis umgeniensis TaxID=336628 RepID=A0A841B9R8_9PSEU|nr:serine/threonine-protein kinase [Amycolatopsis umgeniensis]MBB5857629.1 tetratricopeptide (TPR) repeat protein [Amycolatopsis umgeniensis]